MFSHGGDTAAAGLQQLLDTAQPASAVNSYVRLVMNLMNAYTRDTEEVRLNSISTVKRVHKSHLLKQCR